MAISRSNILWMILKVALRYGQVFFLDPGSYHLAGTVKYGITLFVYSRKAWIRFTPSANKLSGEDPD